MILQIVDQVGLVFLCILFGTTIYTAYEAGIRYNHLHQKYRASRPATAKPFTNIPSAPVDTFVVFTARSGSNIEIFNGTYQAEPYQNSGQSSSLQEARRNSQFTPRATSATPPSSTYMARFFPAPPSFYTVLLWRASVPAGTYDIIVYQANTDSTTGISNQYVLYKNLPLSQPPSVWVLSENNQDILTWTYALGFLTMPLASSSIFGVTAPQVISVQQTDRVVAEQRLVRGNAGNGNFELVWNGATNVPGRTDVPT